MDLYLSVLTASYLIMLISGLVYQTHLTVRSNRTSFYYALFWYGLGLNLWVAVRLVEILVSRRGILQFVSYLSVIITAFIIPLTINLIYSLIMRKLLPFIMQMVGGAAALSIIMFVWPYTTEIKEYYTQDLTRPAFLVYLWLPGIVFTLTIPLVTFAMKKCLINISTLSIERVFASSRDLYFYIDRYGWLADHNAPEGMFGDCRDRTSLINTLGQNINSDQRAQWQTLRQALLLPAQARSGEIKVTSGQELIWYVWTVKPVLRSKDKIVGSFLLLSDRTAVKQYLLELNQQNDMLQRVNNELADYEGLVDRYTEMATRQEVSDYVDISVRYRILQSFDQIKQLMQDTSAGSSQLAIGHLRSECRRALSDVRALVRRLAE